MGAMAFVISAAELSQLWKLHADGLMLLARMRCQAAEDCVQVAFIRLAKLETIPDDPGAWLATVVRNEAISLLRSESRRRRREEKFSENTKQWFDAEQSPEDDLSQVEIKADLQKLETESREIVVAHLWNNLSFRQIAEVFDVSSSAAHRKYVQAIKQMRTVLGVNSESD